MLRRFVEEKIAPRAAGYDEREEYPWESFKACVDMELPSLWVPAAYGGRRRRGLVPRVSRAPRVS